MPVFIQALKLRYGPDFTFISLIKCDLIGSNIEKIQTTFLKKNDAYFFPSNFMEK